MLSSVLTAGRAEDAFEAFFYYGYSRAGKKNETESFTLSLNYKPPSVPWLSASIFTGYVLKTWEDNRSGWDMIYQNRGIGDSSVSLTIDFAEILEPCAVADRRPHFMLSVGTTIPTGAEDDNNSLGLILPSYQMGSGESVPFVSASYTQRFAGGVLSPYLRITESAGMGPNDVGYQRPPSLSWMAGLRVRATEEWSISPFAAISGAHTFSAEKMETTIVDAILGQVRVMSDISDKKTDTISGNVGFIGKPWNWEHTCAGISFIFPLHTSISDKTLEPKWGISAGISFSF